MIAGRGAADYILGKKDGSAVYVDTKGVNGVRYIVPQRVNINGDENVKLYFRVGAVYKGASVVVECDGEVLSSRKRPKLAPGEMENVTITTDMLKKMNKDSVITVKVKEAQVS